MRERISSSATASSKFALPAILVGLVLRWAWSLRDPAFREDLGIAFLYILGFAIATCYVCGRIKRIDLKDEWLIVSNYLSEEWIHVSRIESIGDARHLLQLPIAIHLKTPSRFGRTIHFLPRDRFTNFLGPHPTAERLRRLAREHPIERQRPHDWQVRLDDRLET